MKNIIPLLIVSLFVISCTTDFPKTEINNDYLNGFIEGGDAGGVYGNAGLKITKDSIQMTNWPMSRLTDNLNIILDTVYEDNSEFPGFYSIQLANKAELDQIEFCEAIAYELAQQKLIK